MERFVPKVKKYVSRLKNDKSTPSVPADPAVVVQQSARQGSPAPLDPTSPPQKIWNKAYDELKQPENEQAIVEAYEKILTTYLSPTIETTQDNNGAQNLIDGDPAKRWKQMEQLVQKGLEKTAKDTNRKEKANHWITITQPLRDAVSTGVKAAPDAAIPWAGICCALQILSSPLTEPKKNRDGMTYVLSRMEWYWELWRLVLDENLSSSPTRPLQAELEKQVTTLYQKLLLYQMKSVITYHRSRFAVFLRDLPKLDDWATLVTEIKDAENSVMRDCEQHSTVEIRTNLRGILSSADEQAKHLADIFHQNETQYAWVREERHKEQDNNCLRDLHKTDPRHDKRSIISAKGGLVYDSYRWVTENQQYKQWYDDRSNRLLWIKGDPGKGKTMLLCGIIDELEKSIPNAVFYFFCQASDPSLRSAAYVLRGLIWSLVRTRPSLISHVRQQYDQAGADIFVNHNAWQALSEMLTAILNDDTAADCVFVIDALDECTDGQEKLIDLISRLANTCKARWVISSRNWHTIEAQLNSVTADARLQLELNATAIAEAVHYFINHKVKELALGKRLNDDIRVKLYEYLVANADDTFLWVALVCQELAKLDVAPRHILQVARSFPSGLTKLYERMIVIMNQSRDKKFCEAVLALSAVAIRPLTLSEIATLDGRLEDVSEDLEAITDIVRSCGSFLTIREDTVHIVHQSARDYLIKASEIFPSGIAQQHYEIFVGSLNTMHKKLHRNMYQLESTVLIDEIMSPKNQPLNGMQYACIYWVKHFDAWYSTERHNPDLSNSAYRLLLTFFTTKCLYWFEAMSLLHHVTDTIKAIESGPQELKDLIEDADRWTLAHRSIMDSAPMQLYDSALLFSPQQSKIRQNFDTEAPISIETLCPSFQEWDTCLLTIAGVSSYFPSLEVSPDRTNFAIKREDDVTISILDALTGDHLRSFRADAGEAVLSMSYHPDGRHMASLSRDCQIMIWDIDKQECLQRFEPSKSGRNRSPFGDSIYRVRFSMDGRLLAFSSGSKTIELWDVWERVCLHTFYDGDLHHDDEMEWFDWGLDQLNIPLLLVVKHIDVWHSVQIDVWHSGTGQQLSNSAEIGSKFRAAAVGPDGRRLAVATDEGISIVRWDTNITTQKIIDRDSIDRVQDITWAADGKSLAIAVDFPSAAGSGIVLWDLEKQTELVHSSGYSSHISTLRYGKNNVLATIDYLDHTLKIWSVEFNSDLPVSVKEVTSSLPLTLEQGPNENLAVFKESRDFEFLDLVTGNAQQSIPYSNSGFVDFQFGPENYFAVLSERGIIEIWDLASGDRTNKFQIYDNGCDDDDEYDWPAAMALGTAGRIISIGRQLRIWNLVTGTSLDIPHSFEAAEHRYCACSSDGRLAYNWSDSEVAVWGCDWMKERQHLIEVGLIDGLSINANGLLMILKYGHNTVQIWNCEDGSMIQNYVIPREIMLVGWDLRYQSGLNTEFGIIDLEVEEEEDCRSASSEAGAELPWCPRSLRLAWTEESAWLMKGSRRILWIPRGSLGQRLFSVRTDLETGMSTVAMVHSGHVMILRISAENL
ncbi:related to vegetatible incompatibility protein HET-E-1 [Fusarium torulosum]|uniref:Related to vegetatible incompatibility protein HET-E-1 n=1 Tax=Fusarium torulosum TaxID=33205 RepID=A0AAE8M483_9HYPO|nr:related to vegetatible incompatibility protein HET-E-1 [Fusarium torulosum]